MIKRRIYAGLLPIPHIPDPVTIAPMPHEPSLVEFVARWQASTLTEKSAAQTHFIELC